MQTKWNNNQENISKKIRRRARINKRNQQNMSKASMSNTNQICRICGTVAQKWLFSGDEIQMPCFVENEAIF